MPTRRSKASKRLIVDASVLLAAGTSDHPTSRCCRRTLESILKICHRVVVTPEIQHEWTVRPQERGQRPSTFSVRWRAAMYSRKKVVRLDSCLNPDLRQRVGSLQLPPADRTAIEEDLHLIEAALASDRSVISLDSRVRRCFHTACAEIGELKRIVWMNPVAEHDATTIWLAAGAPQDPRHWIVNYGESERQPD